MLLAMLAAMLLGGCVNVDLSGIPGIADTVGNVRPQPAPDRDEAPRPASSTVLLTDTRP